MSEYGVLFSHAHESRVEGSFPSASLAAKWGDEVVTAQPGIEYRVMHRVHPELPWVDLRTGRSAADVTREEWGA